MTIFLSLLWNKHMIPPETGKYRVIVTVQVIWLEFCFLKILIPEVLIYFIRRQLPKRQRIIHTYGIDVELVDLDEDTALAAVHQRCSLTRQESATREASRQSTQTKTCVCGSKDYMCPSSSLCPLNKRHVWESFVEYWMDERGYLEMEVGNGLMC